MRDEGVLHVVTQYARYGDPGALRYLQRSAPFGSWARRIDRNRRVVSGEPDTDAPPEEFVEDLTEAVRRLGPAERRALHEALYRSAIAR